MFIALLSFNSLYGSTGFFPRFLMDLLSDTHLISHLACFVQIYTFYTYASYEMTILGIMAYDRYVAVCHPLHYHRRMTSKTVIKLAILAWIFPASLIIASVSLSARLPLCGHGIQKIFCANWNVVKLSCDTTIVNNIIGMLTAIVTVFLPLFYVLYTYLRIVLSCWKKTAEFKGKVLQRCLPHLLSFVIYSIVGFCDIALSRYNLEEIHPFLAVALSLEVAIVPSAVNPVVYGLKLPEIRRHILRMILWYKK